MSAGTDSLVDLTRQINTVLHNSDPRWSLLPRSADEVGGIVMVAEHGSEPGDFDRWVNYNFQHGRVTFFLYDHKGDTLRDVIDRATDFIQSHPLEGAEFKLASGYAGVLAAANEVIARSDKLTLGLMLLAQLVFCAIGFRSLVAGLFFVGVVLLSNTFGMALMAYWNVGLNVNTLPVISLGIGFGEDYGIYIVSRIIEEYQRQDRSRTSFSRNRRYGHRRQGRALHRCPGFGRDRILVLVTAPFSSRDGLPAFDYPDDEYAWRSVTASRAYRAPKTEVCHRSSEAVRKHVMNCPQS